MYNVLGMAARLKIPILQASTSEIYGTSEEKEWSEETDEYPQLENSNV